jgi:hypothetical protein
MPRTLKAGERAEVIVYEPNVACPRRHTFTARGNHAHLAGKSEGADVGVHLGGKVFGGKLAKILGPSPDFAHAM